MKSLMDKMNPLVVGDAENGLAQIRVSEPSFQASSALYEDVIRMVKQV